jgi:hypothetical protein
VQPPLDDAFEIPVLVVAVQTAFEDERARVQAIKAAAIEAEEAMIAAEQLRLQTEADQRASDAKAKSAAAAASKSKGRPPIGGSRTSVGSSRALATATASKPKTPDKSLKSSTPVSKAPAASPLALAANESMAKPRTPGLATKPLTPSASKPRTPIPATASPKTSTSGTAALAGRQSPSSAVRK